MNPAAASPRTIRARIHESAVKRVTRAYGGQIADIFLEALQNSRRAGATRVRIAVGPSAPRIADTVDPQFTIAVSDDGCGIADPALLLSFGENGWEDALVRREDAAGFGFASLARRNCTISSRPRSPDGEVSPGSKVELAPEHFLGEADAEVRADDGLPRTGSGEAPFPHGTAVAFRATESAAAIRNAAENAARHYPLRVVFETRAEGEPGGAEELPRRAFLDGAVHAETWRGLAFGVFKGGRRGYNDPDLNFFGLTLPVRLPTVETVHGATWTVRADVQDCPNLELVLPARKEAVENDFLAEMRESARLAIYRAMAADPAPRPAFGDRERARQAGIDIAPPPAVLRPWRPPVAETDYWREPAKLAPAGHHACPGALVMVCDPEPPEAQALWRAAERAGVASRLFEADCRLDGYGWYDTLDRVTALHIQAAADGEWMAIGDYPLPERPGPRAAILPARPAALRIELTVSPRSGPPATLDLPADMAFAGEAWSWLDEALPLVTVDSTLRPHDLADLLRASFFSPSDDADSDNWETQRDRFDEEALHLATRLLLSDDEACRNSLAEAVRRELLRLCPRGRTVDIRIRRPDIAVTLAESGPAS